MKCFVIAGQEKVRALQTAGIQGIETDNLTDKDKINANIVFNTEKEEVLSEQDKKNANIIFE